MHSAVVGHITHGDSTIAVVVHVGSDEAELVKEVTDRVSARSNLSTSPSPAVTSRDAISRMSCSAHSSGWSSPTLDPTPAGDPRPRRAFSRLRESHSHADARTRREIGPLIASHTRQYFGGSRQRLES